SISLGIQFGFDSLQFRFPVFNPNNPHEIIYQYINYQTDVFQLLKYNYTTKQKQMLVDNFRTSFQPEWSRLNFIEYYNYFVQPVKINLNGEFIPPNANPFTGSVIGLPNGKEVVWNNGNSIFKKNINQNKIDTLVKDISSKVYFSTTGIALFRNIDGFQYTDLNSLTESSTVDYKQISINIQGSIPGLCWHPSGKKFYVSQIFDYEKSGIYEVEFPSGKARKIIQFCDKRVYKSLSCSTNGNYLVGEGIDMYQQFDNQGNFTGKIFENSNIYLINIQTSEEIKLDL
ncbi:hypothetical protein, partial [Flavobacterium sp.]|uniref:hypothetical protein n=1 Tax=Flavobacterium sp. TaxID=239 RepID=UPI0026249E57